MLHATFLLQFDINSVIYSQEETKEYDDLVFEKQGLRTSPLLKILNPLGMYVRKYARKMNVRLKRRIIVRT
jgi:hypothetical protein